MSAPAEMSLFLEALELDGPARESFVDAIDDQELQQRVRALLVAHESVGGEELVAPALSRFDPASYVGLDVDGYRILSVVGRGGMGIVFEAEQRDPRRRVALKTLPAAAATEEGLRRLESEGRMLARLSDPGIAHVYDSGRSEALGGLPYVVMELIDGQPIDSWVREREADAGECLRLLADVCDAVGHAHERGVMHRDLKPGNVLVDGQGRVKVLDFGIARLVDGSESMSLQTRTGQILGTLPYMAPEQVAGDSTQIDNRADVYALGVLGYELLSGQLPIDVVGVPVASAVRRIVEVEPRGLLALDRTTDRDVATVVHKAMEKEADRRYANAAEFAADLRRVLQHEPIVARAPSRTYLLRKMVRRNRAAFAAALGVIVALVVGLTWALIERAGAIEAQAQAEDSARLERLRAASMSRLTGVFSQFVYEATPHENGGRAPTMTEVVDNFAARLETEVADDGYIRARAYLMLATTSVRRGQVVLARERLERARVEFARSELTEDSDRVRLASAASAVASAEGRPRQAMRELRGLRETAERGGMFLEELWLSAYSRALFELAENPDEAVAVCERRVEITELGYGKESAQHVAALHSLGRAVGRAGGQERAIEVYERTLELRRRLQPGSLGLASTLNNLAILYLGSGLHEACRKVAAECLEIRRSIFSEAHPELCYALDNLGIALVNLGRAPEALPLFSEAAAAFDELYDGPHADRAVCLSEWGRALVQSSQAAEGLERLDASIAEFEAVSDDVSPTAYSYAHRQRAYALMALGRAKEAVTAAERSVELVEGVPTTAKVGALAALCNANNLVGDWAATERAARKILAFQTERADAREWAVKSNLTFLFTALAMQERYDEALEAVDEFLDAALRLGTNQYKETGYWAKSQILRRAGRPEEAQKVLEELERAKASW